LKLALFIYCTFLFEESLDYGVSLYYLLFDFYDLLENPFVEPIYWFYYIDPLIGIDFGRTDAFLIYYC
jgi:hypothetical protein